MRRPLIVLIAVIAVIALCAVGVLWVVDTARPPAGGSPGTRLYAEYCAACHGADGRGSLRAKLFLIRPGDFTDPAQMAKTSDRYLFDVIKNGGSPIGIPGMPAFGSELTDADIRALVAHVRRFARPSPKRS